MMKKITSLLLLWVMVLPLWAQFHDPVSFLFPKKKLSDSEFEIVFTGKAEAGWHVYSTDIPDGGLLRLPLISMNRKEWSR